jgi:signal transduction histidine kinase
MSRLRLSRWDVALVLAAASALVLDGRLGHGTDSPLPIEIVLAVVTCIPLAFRKRTPVASIVLLEVGLAACTLVFEASDAAVGILAVVLFLAALEGDRRSTVTVGLATALILAITVVLLGEGAEIDAGTISRILVVLGSIVLGDTVRSRRELRAAREERLAREERQREERARERLLRERLRIARELHDTIAHALVGINVRAAVAAHLGEDSKDAAALTEIKEVSAQALGDLRETLDLLRDGAAPAPSRPVRGLDSLPQLLDGVRAAGIETRSEIRTNGEEVSRPVSEAAFRIVQESLTNVLRHARASRADVLVESRPDSLAVEVVDDGRGGEVAWEEATGHGLRGMSERVQTLGGRLNVGPIEPSGWRVFAELPLDGGLGQT